MTEQAQGRYVVSEGWSHVFGEGRRDVRFVYDREAGAVAFMQVGTPDGWSEADEIQRDDVSDSLRTANPEALDNPSAWGMTETDDAPDWSVSASGPSPR